MKKGLKKTLAALAAGAMLLSMNMSAFALTYNASTKYTNDSTATVTVSNVKTGANDQVAFLAENGSDIIYIEQKQADETGAVEDFSFAIELEDAIATPTIKVGSTSEAADGFKSIKLAGKNITLSVDSEKGLAEIDATTVYENAFKVYAVAYSGFKVASYTIGENTTAVIPKTEGNYSYFDVSLDGVAEEDVTVVVNFAEVDLASDATIAVAQVNKTAGRGFTVIGTAANAADFGVLLATDAEGDEEFAAVTVDNIADYNAFSSGLGVRKFAAMAADANGTFSITVEDSLVEEEYKHLPNGTYLVKGYSAGKNLATVAAETVTFE